MRTKTYGLVLSLCAAVGILMGAVVADRNPLTTIQAEERRDTPTPLVYPLKGGAFLDLSCAGDLTSIIHPHLAHVECAVALTPSVTPSLTPLGGTATATPPGANTATVTGTPAAVSATSTSTPTVAMTRLPTYTPTISPTVHTITPYGLGIRLNGDADVTNFWIAHAQPQDEAHGGHAVLASMLNVKASGHGRTMFLATTPDQSGVDTAVSEAKANGFAIIEVNDEGPACGQLVVDEARQSAQVHGGGLFFTFAPAGFRVMDCLPSDVFATGADTLFFQGQLLEYKDPNLAATSHAIIHAIRKNHPNFPITEQLSMNPPNGPGGVAQVSDVVNWVQLLEDGSDDAPNLVSIFYTMGDPGRIAAMKEVITTLRPIAALPVRRSLPVR